MPSRRRRRIRRPQRPLTGYRQLGAPGGILIHCLLILVASLRKLRDQPGRGFVLYPRRIDIRRKIPILHRRHVGQVKGLNIRLPLQRRGHFVVEIDAIQRDDFARAFDLAM